VIVNGVSGRTTGDEDVTFTLITGTGMGLGEAVGEIVREAV